MIKIFKGSLQGICIGSLLFLISSLFFTDSQIQKMVISTLFMCGIMGASSVIYEFRRIPFLTQIFIHLGSSWGAFLFTAYINQWFPFKIGILLTSSMIFLVIFFAIWVIFYFKAKKELAEINQRLK